MFFPIPVRLHDGREFHAIPVVNGLLIVANVLFFWMGWHPVVGPGTGIFSIGTYAFGHASLYHLVANMWVLLVFGTPVNRRLGNGWYLLTYFGTVLALGIFARLLCPGPSLGASGAIFAIIAIAVILMPSSLVDVAYFAFFPLTLLIGLISKPKHFVFWFIRWDMIQVRAYWGILLVPLLELSSLFWTGWNWSNIGHLFGLVCGVAAVLMLPETITKNRRRSSVFVS